MMPLEELIDNRQRLRKIDDERQKLLIERLERLTRDQELSEQLGLKPLNDY